jgi:hypothetical protein
MSKLLATVAAIGFVALIAPSTASAHEQQTAAGVTNANSIEISAAKRHHRRHYRHHRRHHHVWRHHYRPYYYGPYAGYAYAPYYRPGPRVYVGPGGFGFGFGF